MSLDGRKSVAIPQDSNVIHEGNAYILTSAAVLSIAKDSNLDIMIQTGANEVHLRDITVNVNKTSASGQTYLTLFEGTTTSANGTALTARNANRNSANTSSCSFFQGPTVTATGTPLYVYIVHTDWETYIAPSYTTPFELVLKPNTKYLIRLTNELLQTIQATYFIFITDQH
jgi:hypothetical protein